MPDLNQEHFTIHKADTFQVLKHDKPSSSSAHTCAPFASSDEEEDDVAPIPRRSKNADPPSWVGKGKEDVQREFKKLTWFQRQCFA